MFNGVFGVLPESVDGRCVSIVLVEERVHGFDDPVVYGCGRGIVEIDVSICAHVGFICRFYNWIVCNRL